MPLPIAAQPSCNLSLASADDLAGASGQGLWLARRDRPPARPVAGSALRFAASARS
jgi:hypothetical protein